MLKLVLTTFILVNVFLHLGQGLSVRTKRQDEDLDAPSSGWETEMSANDLMEEFDYLDIPDPIREMGSLETDGQVGTESNRRRKRQSVDQEDYTEGRHMDRTEFN
ncbi:hypothetical protein HDE_09126 [Halotydeus destructor]|nr:hypothetical protein HDE_09126 [Halotydeus destructor]